jgi:hypothetical protein
MVICPQDAVKFSNRQYTEVSVQIDSQIRTEISLTQASLCDAFSGLRRRGGMGMGVRDPGSNRPSELNA